MTICICLEHSTDFYTLPGACFRTGSHSGLVVSQRRGFREARRYRYNGKAWSGTVKTAWEAMSLWGRGVLGVRSVVVWGRGSFITSHY
ncbi:MAG: hypothetical protein LBU17_01720 [Treponema sp.]|nr:hypothetical protein [Treponema sp.]